MTTLLSFEMMLQHDKGNTTRIHFLIRLPQLIKSIQDPEYQAALFAQMKPWIEEHMRDVLTSLQKLEI